MRKRPWVFATRSTRPRLAYVTVFGAEVEALAFEGPTPDAPVLSRRWRTALGTAAAVVELLPPEHAGKAVLTGSGELYRGDSRELAEMITHNHLQFHEGRIGGALPQVVGPA